MEAFAPQAPSNDDMVRCVGEYAACRYIVRSLCIGVWQCAAVDDCSCMHAGLRGAIAFALAMKNTSTEGKQVWVLLDEHQEVVD